MIENTVSGFNPVNIILLGALLALVPFFLTLVTAYIKVIVVTYLIRNALGVQQVPPTMVLTGLAMILSVYVMAPVGLETYELLQAKNALSLDLTPAQILQTAAEVSEPLKQFLIANTEPNILKSLVNTAGRIWPAEIYQSIDSESFIYVVPSFVISELTKAFQIGFLLYLPFIAIDLIISNILLAMGMMMVSPMTISLPFKLMLFVTLEGWLKLCQGLLYSYTYT
ncbi:MAG: type III secretion system export apparatus subunit SctR [Proteobacteria bacterium]|uniref:Type III secretion system export apparatus subunit SctR n=1 Tax=Candidatus Avisuccinivibrio stercorigallinarum TaxID=2840704 RepID=A0A9D9DDJ6_9GAMM|nr:type III secretion system export apparatus subunit SctR [Candidatus Avisuccinivibrio stercorigallinarum]